MIGVGVIAGSQMNSRVASIRIAVSNTMATACRWGFHKYSGITHFIDIAESLE